MASIFHRLRPPEKPVSTPVEDARLVVLAQVDQHLFAAIYDRHFAGIYGYCYRSLGTVERAEARPVALVLGAGLRRDGRPTLLLARRLDIAADLYHRGTVDAVLVSGADEEPAAMRRYLLTAGVPDAKIVGDVAGFRTWDSCVRAHEVFGVRSASRSTSTCHARSSCAGPPASTPPAWATRACRHGASPRSTDG